MRTLIRFIYPWLYSFIFLVIGTSYVSADTTTNTLTFNIQNNNTASYTNYPFIVALNNTQLVTLGYISSTGLNTQTSRPTSATNFPSGLSSSNLTVLVDQCLGNRVNSYSYKMGYDPARTDIDIITGNGGYISLADSSSLEPSYGIVTYSNTTAWYNPSWTYRKNLTVYGSSSGAQTNYTKLVRVMHNGAAPLNNTAENIAQLTTGDDVTAGIYGGAWDSQTFTAETTGTVKKVWLKLIKLGSPTSSYACAIRAVNATGCPTGVNLCSGNITSTYVSAIDGWYEFDMGVGTSLTSGTQYAAIFYTSGLFPNYLGWRLDQTAAPYSGGTRAFSGDFGALWTPVPTQDFMFQILTSTAGATPLAISTEGNCQDDFDDIRFTTEDGSTLLDYWIETKVDSWYADCWVELNSIVGMTGTSEHSHFSMYYGNAAATAYGLSLSAGENTFTFFDDFSGAYPGTKWAGDSAYGSISGGVLNYSVSGGAVKAINGTILALTNTSIMRWYSFMKSGVDFSFTGLNYMAAYDLGLYNSLGTATLLPGTVTSSWTFNAYKTWEIRVVSANISLFTENGSSLTGSPTSSTPNLATPRLMGYNTGTFTLVDWIFTSKFIASQPLWGVPASQETFSSTSITTYYPLTFYTSWKGYFDNSTSGYLFGRPSSFSFNSTGSGGVSVYGNSTSLISYSPVTSGTHNITIYTPTNYTLNLDIDGVNVASSAIGNISDTSTSWFISSSGPARSTEWFYYKIGGSSKIYYQPANIIVGSTLPDLSGMGNHGTIVWGTNPMGTGTYTSGIAATGSYVMGSSTIDPDTEVTIIPVPGVVNLSGDETHTSTPPITPTGWPGPVDPITPGGLPVYELVDRAATSLGWTANTLYGVLMWMTAIAMGAGAFIATGSLFGGGVMLVGTLAVASSTGVIPAWLPIIMGLALVFIVVLSRSM